jgi:hypothetical protein
MMCCDDGAPQSASKADRFLGVYNAIYRCNGTGGSHRSVSVALGTCISASLTIGIGQCLLSRERLVWGMIYQVLALQMNAAHDGSYFV